MNAKIESLKDIKDEDSMPEFTHCLQRIALLQEHADKLAELDKPRRSRWFGSTPNQDSQLAQHVAAIIWFLGHRYSTASKRYDSMREAEQAARIRSKKAQDRRLAALASVKQKSPTTPKSFPVVEEQANVQDFAQKYGLSPDQIQMLQSEKDALFQELEGMKNQVRQTEQSVSEIARLQTTLQESLVYQEGQIERIYEDVDLATDMVSKGNVFLGKASKNQSTFSKIMVTLILAMTFVMLFMHFYLD